MPTPCIHGFQAGQCAACPAPGSTRNDASPTLDPEKRGGWEIFYVPAVSGWQLRAPEETVLPDSYRSLFLARKAVDQMIANSPATRPSKQPK